MTELTVGAIQALYRGEPEPVAHPLVQVIDIKKIATTQAGASDRYRIVVSDSKHYQQAILATQMNGLIESEQIRNLCVVKLTEKVCNTVQDRRVIIVIGLEVVRQEANKIGEPVNVESALGGAAAAGGAPAAAAPAAAAVKPAAPAQPAAPAGGNPYAAKNSGYGANSYGGAGAGGAKNINTIPIQHLNPYQNKWTIQARVTNKSDMRHYTSRRGGGEGKLFSVDLLDKDGTEIRCTAFNETADQFYDRLIVGNVYYISKGSLKIADRRFNNLNNQYEITFDRNTTVEECADAADISMMRYSFIPIDSLTSQAPESIIDTIGVVTSIEELTSIISKRTGNTIPKRNITLMDMSGHAVSVTLWSQKAEEFNYTGNPVVAIKGAKVSDFGGVSLNSLNSSLISVNPDIPEAAALQAWYQAEGSSAVPTSLSTGGGPRSEVRKTLSAIKDENLGSGLKPDYFLVRATISYIRNDGTLWYQACPGKREDGKDCNKKVTEISPGQFRCERCDRSFPECVYRYVFAMNVADHTGSHWLSLFDDDGKVVLGLPAAELVTYQNNEGDPRFEEVFTNAVFKTYNFTVRAKTETYNDEARVKCQITRADPINYRDEANNLLKLINEYGV